MSTASTATVTRLPRSEKAAKRPVERQARKPRNAPMPSRAARLQLYSGVSVVSVAAVLTGVSLSHLAHGIEAVAHVGALDAWATAGGIDLGFIALETASVFACGAAAETIHRWARPTVVAMMMLSALLNALAYSANASAGLDAWVSAAVGAALPVAIYVLTRVGFAALSRKAS